MNEAADRHRSGGELASYLASLDIDQDWRWAYRNFEGVVTGLIREFRLKDVCELGGGRRPFLSREQIYDLDVNYVINDIAAGELGRAPGELAKACFDLAAVNLPTEFHKHFDFVFSRMLMEHVSDGRQAYKNIFHMLKDDGIFFNFHPVLYSMALTMNWLTPEKLSKPILRHFQPHRHDDDRPKFPARYSYCVINRKNEGMLRAAGFREVFLLPFYGHDYFKRVPILQSVSDVVTDCVRRSGIHRLATLCFAIGRK
jgi:SAM-dependent methyltransferase